LLSSFDAAETVDFGRADIVEVVATVGESAASLHASTAATVTAGKGEEGREWDW
jgi:hypothetical protein